jgi:peptidoglycan/xylan/chitin deacetylase (PgdA/CDA1 family)
MKPFFSVTVDIEDWYHHPAISGTTFSKYASTEEFFKSWNKRYDYISKPTKRILNLLAEYNLTATFFVVGEVANRYDGLVESIIERGHEIACHGYDHSSPIDPRKGKQIMTRALYRENVFMAKEILENITGELVTGYRAPGAFIAGWMIDVLEELGFKYDSSVSVNSLYNKTDSSLTNVGRKPYFPEKGSLLPGAPRGIIEIPWPYLQVGPIKVPTAGAFFLRLLGSRIIHLGIKQSLQTGSSFLYFHPEDIASSKTPAKFSKNRPFYWTFKGPITEKRIKWLLSNIDAEFVTMEEYAHRWDKKIRNNSQIC